MTERLLAAIEKLIKRPLERGVLEGLRPRERRDDRRPPPGRGERLETRPERDPDAAGQQAGPRAARYASRSRGHHEVVDDFFVKPYEPQVAAADVPDPEPATSTPAIEKPARRIAALLGGTKKG